MAKRSNSNSAKDFQKKLSGAEGFNEYYSRIYGERWPALKAALFIDTQYGIFSSPDSKEYFLDSGSILAAFSLPLENAENILDMCAAPGGKSLILASRMNISSSLVCNERSAERRNRLHSVVNEFLNPSISQRIKITSMDGALICRKFPESFDAVLLDAPCSSERHVINSPQHLSIWTETRIRNLSYTQWSLLSSAYLSLKPGGFLVYSTCALSPAENDRIVEKLIKKYQNAVIYRSVNHNLSEEDLFSCVQVLLPQPEQTEYGWHILPDKTGSGPIYFSVIHKEKLMMDL